MRTIVTGIMAALAALGAAWVLAGLPPVGDGVLRGVLALPATAVLWTLVALVHQAGHALGGTVVGLRVTRLDAGLLRIVRTDRRLALRPALAGLATRLEPSADGDLRRRWLVTVLCGPVLSLMFGAQCLAVWLATSSMLLAGNASHLVRATSSALLLAGAGSLLLGLAALVPLHIGPLRTDGWTALRLLRHDANVADDVAHHTRD
ncbi:MAG TPA: hypothetical protein VK928_02120 [Longimicrobiales bacterium]|nr:hypothetical protein [Longimicrobiales bacterium]